MKNFVKYILQKLLGYQRYLFVFAKYKIRTLKNDSKEGDFFAFLNEIKKDGILLDVGANIGIMTYHMSKKFQNRKTLAIEPMPSNISILKKIIGKYQLKNVKVIPSAVGNKSENIEMVLPVNGKVKMQGLAHVVHDTIGEWNEGEKIKVECRTLDSIVKDDHVAGIKMDIENFEFFALEGAIEIIKRDHPVIYLELWANENRNQCFGYLEALGYKAFVKIGDSIIEFDQEVHKKQNFIFKI